MEQWRDVPGFEGRYQVSDFGRVAGVERYVRCGRGGKGRRLIQAGVLRPASSPSGHLCVVLGKGRTMHVHVVVALAFIGPRPAGADVAHRDGNPTNNTPRNLRYATRSENNQDKVLHGRTALTVEQVHRVRKEAPTLPHGGKKALALELNTHPCTISDVLAGRRYAHV